MLAFIFLFSSISKFCLFLYSCLDDDDHRSRASGRSSNSRGSRGTAAAATQQLHAKLRSFAKTRSNHGLFAVLKRLQISMVLVLVCTH